MKAIINKFRAVYVGSTVKEKGLSTLLVLMLTLSISGMFTLGEAFLAQSATFDGQSTSEAVSADPSQDMFREIEDDSDYLAEIANGSGEDTAGESITALTEIAADDSCTDVNADETTFMQDEDETSEVNETSVAVIPARGPLIGFPMYSWGNNSAGHLGLGDTTVRTTPQLVPGGAKWVTSVTAAGGSFAICVDGYLYGWGAARGANHMGQGGNVAHLPATLTTPTRIGDANNWVYVSARGSNTSVGAVRADGTLWTWGNNNRGQLGLGDTTNRNAPTQVGTGTNWATVTVGGNSAGENNTMMLGVLQNGQAWSWGYGASAVGLLGRDSSAGANRQNPQLIPDLQNHQVVSVALGGRVAAVVTAEGQLFTWGSNLYSQLGRTASGTGVNHPGRPRQAGAAINWQEVRATNRATAALCTAGRLFTWGTNNGGELGNGSSTGSTNTITQRMVGTSDWVSIHGGNSHFLAFRESGWLYAWGNNGSGQLGVGGTTNRTSPTRVVEAQNFTTAARGGGTHSIMLMHIEPVEPDEFFLEKILKMPAGTSAPDLNFIFNMNRRSFNGLDTPEALDNFPAYDTIRDVTINDSSSVVSDPEDSIVRLSGLVDILEDVSFFGAGVYAWTITEEPYSSGATPPSQVAYSLVQYKFIVEVRQEPGVGGNFYIYDMSSYRIRDEKGDAIDPPEPGPIVFENIYKRTTTGTAACPGALFISKTVDGVPADPTTVFEFDITLTATALCPDGTIFTGRVYVGNTFVREEGPFASGTSRTVELLDGQKIVFPALIVGTHFDVTERAIDNFIAEVLLYVNGEYTTITNPNSNMDLSIEGPHRIEDVSRNSADFTNEHDFIPIPTGLSLSSNSSWIAVVAGFMFVFLLFSKLRRKELLLLNHRHNY